MLNTAGKAKHEIAQTCLLELLSDVIDSLLLICKDEDFSSVDEGRQILQQPRVFMCV